MFAVSTLHIYKMNFYLIRQINKKPKPKKHAFKKFRDNRHVAHFKDLR